MKYATLIFPTLWTNIEALLESRAPDMPIVR